MDQWQSDEEGNRTRTVTVDLPPGVTEILGGGNSSFVGLLDDGTVLKFPHLLAESLEEFEAEAAIYQALGSHPRIIGFLGRSEHGIRLERGSSFLECLDATADDDQGLNLKLRWIRQIAEGLS